MLEEIIKKEESFGPALFVLAACLIVLVAITIFLGDNYDESTSNIITGLVVDECYPLAWECSEWSVCVDGMMTRRCLAPNSCSDELEPALSAECDPNDTCVNGILDPDEEKIDCGKECGPCPSCLDGLLNCEVLSGGIKNCEEGVDCGGPCEPCPTCSDGIRNCHMDADGTQVCEILTDCGGPCESCERPNKKSANSLLVSILFAGLLIAISAGAVVLFHSMHKKGRAPSTELVSYADKMILKGYSEDQVKQHLIESGWSNSDARKAVFAASQMSESDRLRMIKDKLREYDLTKPNVIEAIVEHSQYPEHIVRDALDQLKKSK